MADELRQAQIQKYKEEWKEIQGTQLWKAIAAWIAKKLDAHTSMCTKTGLGSNDAICYVSKSQGALGFIHDLFSEIENIVKHGSTR